jgi:hypothetical protein
MDLADLDNRQIAIILSRARCVIGLTCIFAPGIVTRVFLGTNAPAAKAATRFVGIRDLALGVGALTNLKERSQDAEWVSMGAISDSVDGITSLVQPGLPARSRLLGVGALGAGALLLKLSRDLAAERTAVVDVRS